MEKITITLLIICLVLLAIFITLLGSQPTGKVVAGTKSFTKAICNETNYCEDYHITCANNEVVSSIPTGYAVQYPEEWNDPRQEDEINRSCEYFE